MKKIYLFAIAVCTSLAIPLTAQVTVNEYSASNLLSYTDSFLKTEDWIELYNNSNDDFDLSGWHLSDKESKPEKWVIPAGTMIPANGHLLFLCSGRDIAVNGELHTNFKLTQTKGSDQVVLANTSGEIVEAFPMTLTLTEHSNCRDTDGSDSWKICTEASPAESNDASTKYDGYTIAPSMDLEAGFYSNEQTVTITNNEPNSILRYTLDGTNPIVSSPIYSGPITVSETQVIKAQSFSNDSNILLGKMDFNTYFINDEYLLPVFSVAADSVIDLANGNGPVIPIGSIEYFNKNDEREATSFGSLNRHGQDSWVLDHRSLDWISRDEMGYSKAVNAPIFDASDRDEYQKFMFRNSGDDNYPAIDDGQHEFSTHIRDEYVQTLAVEGGMKLDHRTVQRVHLFLNGQYWGLYGMREKVVDHDYTNEYYDQGKYDLQYLGTWGNTDIEYGGIEAQDAWLGLRNFILESDMSVEENYRLADDSLNMVSMIDYFLVNLTAVASDWLNYNTGWWRGTNPDGDHKKWGYILWDLDATYDYYINYSGVPNISPDAQPCDLEVIADFMDGFFGNGGGGGVVDPADCATIANGSSPYPADDPFFISVVNQDQFCCDTDWDDQCQNQYDAASTGTGGGGNPGGGGGIDPEGDVGKHEKILLKLLAENAEFKQLYYSRYADMMNTTFSCENMLGTLDRMLDDIRPEMPKQIARWGGTMDEWESNVQRLKDFIGERCTLLDDGMLNCYDELTGPYEITLMTEPAGVGEIDFNTLDREDLPWTGNYFGGMENKIKAKALNDFEDDYEFSHWESRSGNMIFPDVNTRKAAITLTTPDTLVAVFQPITGVNDIDQKYDLSLYPNPAKDYLTFEYELDQTADVSLSLHNVMGSKIRDFGNHSGRKSTGAYTEKLDLTDIEITTGMYLLKVRIDQEERTFKVNLIK